MILNVPTQCKARGTRKQTMWPHGKEKKPKVHISFQETEKDKSPESHLQKSLVRAFYIAVTYFRNKHLFKRILFSERSRQKREEYSWDKHHKRTDIKEKWCYLFPTRRYSTLRLTKMLKSPAEWEAENHIPIKQKTIHLKILIRLLITQVYIANLPLLYFLFKL